MPYFQQRGFNLVELSVSVAIMSFLLGTAIPAIGGLHHYSRHVGITNEVNTTISVARAEAVTQSQDLIMCPISLIDSSCSDDWNNEVVIFSDTNNNFSLDEGEKRLNTLSAGGKIDWQIHDGIRHVVIDQNGALTSAQRAIDFCINFKVLEVSTSVILFSKSNAEASLKCSV